MDPTGLASPYISFQSKLPMCIVASLFTNWSLRFGALSHTTKEPLKGFFCCVWTRQDSNLPPPACKAGALPDELRALVIYIFTRNSIAYLAFSARKNKLSKTISSHFPQQHV